MKNKKLEMLTKVIKIQCIRPVETIIFASNKNQK